MCMATYIPITQPLITLLSALIPDMLHVNYCSTMIGVGLGGIAGRLTSQDYHAATNLHMRST